MSVRAKFVCNQTDPQLQLNAVCDGSEENKAFFEATPTGYISMGIVNPDALKQFEVGKEYYVDFTPAAPQEETPSTGTTQGS